MVPPPTLHHRLRMTFLCALAGLTLSLGAPVIVARAQYVVQIPIVRLGVARTPTPGPPQPCPLAQELGDLITQSPEQRRPYMVLDPILQQVAQARADDLASRDYFEHTNPDGYAANYLVRQAGYALPSYYGAGPTDNNIESLAAGDDRSQSIWAAWLDSSGHRVHILGETNFFASQIDYGIAYAYNPDSTYQHYWVFISAQKGN